MKNPILVLEKGKTYSVADVYGEVAWDGQFLAVIQDKESTDLEELFLFAVPTAFSTHVSYAMVRPEIYVDGLEIRMLFRVVEYANQVSDFGKKEQSEWEIVE